MYKMIFLGFVAFLVLGCETEGELKRAKTDLSFLQLRVDQLEETATRNARRVSRAEKEVAALREHLKVKLCNVSEQVVVVEEKENTTTVDCEGEGVFKHGNSVFWYNNDYYREG